MYRIMVVDNEPLINQTITEIIENNFKNIEICATTGNGLKAINYARNKKPDIIFIDIKLNGLNGLETLNEIIKFLPETISIIVSACDSFKFAQQAIRLGVMDYLLKPITQTEIKHILTKAINTLDKYRLKPPQKILLTETDRDGNYYQFKPPLELEKKLLKAIENGITDKVQLELNSLFNYLKDIDLTTIHNYFQELLAVVFRVIYDYLPTGKRKDINPGKLRERLSSASTREELYNSLEEAIITYMKVILPYIETKRSPVLKKVQQYIKENYHKNISLGKIADNVSISRNYLCKLFKDYYGHTIIDYLTAVRVHEGIRLLNKTDLSIKEISRRVGYQDANYFSKVIKKKTGKTPSEFRR